MHPEVRPPERGFYGMVYISETDRILLWGGTTPRDIPDLRVWEYDYNANTWTVKESPTDAPEQRAGFLMFYHAPAERMIVYGGLTEHDGRMVDQTAWAYDYPTNSWQVVEMSENPGKRAFFPMAYSPSIDKVFIFGGETFSKFADRVTSEAWMFDPTTNEWKNVVRP